MGIAARTTPRDVRHATRLCSVHYTPRTRAAAYASPQSAMTTASSGRSPRSQRLPSILLTSSMPSSTQPNTTCLPSSQGVTTVVMKNCEPLVFGPAFAWQSHVRQTRVRRAHSSEHAVGVCAHHRQQARDVVLQLEVLI